MLIFQINPNQLKEGQEIKSKDWAFWNTYLKARVDENDYVLLPDYIDFITNTEPTEDMQNETYLVELNENDDEET